MATFKYIAIGASAGGLTALQNLLEKLPKTTNFIYIIVQHRSTEHKSLLAEILGKITTIPVIEPQDKEILKKGNIYLISSTLHIVDDEKENIVAQSIVEPLTLPRPSIDDVFTSLAKHRGTQSIGIILSGTGHDGTKGLRAIKSNGGICIAQEPQEAEYGDMPKTAIDADAINQVLSIQGIAKILSILGNEDKNDEKTALEAIRTLLYSNDQIDIGKYKEKTVFRRIHKRMMMLHIDSLEGYVYYLLKHKEESVSLYQDILIGVTKFFREPEAFEALKDTFLSKLKLKKDNDELRVWITACSSGEEAYSIAIMFCELLEHRANNIGIRIFATDIDDKALKEARDGSYKEETLKDIPTNLRSKYFISNGKEVEVNERLKSMIVFTHHDLLQDPPFIKMDLISCRNALIYFTPNIQEEIFSMFHYSLSDEGILFLGISESASHYFNYFSVINNQWKIYQKTQVHNPPKLPKRFFQTFELSQSNEILSEPIKISYSTIEQAISDSIHNFVMLASIVINAKEEIVYTKGEISYLKFSQGFASLNLFKNIHPALHLEVKNALQETQINNTRAISKFVELSDKQQEGFFVRVITESFFIDKNTPLTLLYFQEIRSEEMVYASGRLDTPNEAEFIRSLESQLSQIKSQLRAQEHKLETSRENMQMMHEELQSSNEELQASNEELETSNEELQTSNEDLNRAYLETDLVQKQLLQILESSSEGILGLDLEQKHTFVNNAAARMLGYTAEYLIGKPSHPIWHHSKRDGTSYSANDCPVSMVLLTGENTRGEELIWHSDGTSFEVEFVVSVIKKDGKITGAVLFFHDISHEKELQNLVKKQEELTNRYLDVAGMVVVLDKNADIVLINKKGSEILEGEPDDFIGKNWFDKHIDQENIQKIKAVFSSVMREKTDLVHSYTNEVLTLSGQKRLIYWQNTLLKDEKKQILGVISAGTDITDLDALQRKLQENEEMMIAQSRQAAMGDMISMIAHQWRQPISIISMVANNLRADIDLENEIEIKQLNEFIDTISSQTEHLSQTIDDFRNFFKPNKEKEKTTLCRVIENVLSIVKKSLDNNNITLEYTKDSRSEFLTYPNELVQVFLNLIMNAKEAIIENKIEQGAINIEIIESSTQIQAVICDNGLGINENIINELGNPYVSSKSKNGTGLGLYMSIIIVTKHLNGTLTWKNSDAGACFTITLPYEEKQ